MPYVFASSNEPASILVLGDSDQWWAKFLGVAQCGQQVSRIGICCANECSYGPHQSPCQVLGKVQWFISQADIASWKSDKAWSAYWQ